jgi:Ca2+-transporting ATPase
VVGDIILLETGGRVPADSILIEGADLAVDETYYYAVNAKASKKTVATEDNIKQKPKPDPFILSNTMVVQGSGRALVCAVGAFSRRGILDDKLDTESKTPLQTKLHNLGTIFTKYALMGALIIFLAYIFNFCMRVFVSGNDENRQAANIIRDIAECFTLAIVMVMVSVPEGLPLAIVMSLAYSVMKMKDDGILVRDLNAPEKMGRVTEVCTGKTSTLTKGDMKISQLYSQSILVQNSKKDTILKCELFDEIVEHIKESILYNCEARIEMSLSSFYVPVGNPTEVGLLKFL